MDFGAVTNLETSALLSVRGATPLAMSLASALNHCLLQWTATAAPSSHTSLVLPMDTFVAGRGEREA